VHRRNSTSPPVKSLTELELRLQSAAKQELTVTTRTALKYVVSCGFVLLGVAATAPVPGATRSTAPTNETEPDVNPAFPELPDGRGGTSLEPILYTDEMGFD
jgi:hypothetical protein